MAGAVYSTAGVNDRQDEQSSARKATIVLYVVMAAGVLLPFVLLWLKR